MRLTVLAFTLVLACAPNNDAQPLADCEWCGMQDMPSRLSSDIRIAPKSEAGEPLVITGRVVRKDGKTPAAGVVLYAYHTNAKGIYPKRGDEKGNDRRHGYLRGWLRTDGQGRYRITTIRPGSYPQGGNPAHIHMTVKDGNGEEYWIDEIHFAGDPYLTPRMSGPGVITLKKDADGTWRGTRDIVLPR